MDHSSNILRGSTNLVIKDLPLATPCAYEEYTLVQECLSKLPEPTKTLAKNVLRDEGLNAFYDKFVHKKKEI